MDGQQSVEGAEFGANRSWVPEMFVLLAQRQTLPFPKAKHPNSQFSGCENTAFPLHPDSMVVF